MKTKDGAFECSPVWDWVVQCQVMWVCFNAERFDGRLMNRPIFNFFESEILGGYFHDDGKKPEIWLNAQLFGDRKDEFEEVLLHEMVHQLQFEAGRRIMHDAFFKKEVCRIGAEV